jgi:GntR family transcriptional regulator, transcriptional repressor for pyruvate dehydrogenase complex
VTKPKQRHETVVSHILNQIYTGTLTPGTKLPTEKKLSEEMGVDRTTLRVALKQLESMHVLEIRQGDGIYVKDYLEHAGMDFLRVLMLSQGESGEKIIDQYLFDDLLEFWIAFLPEIIRMAAAKASPRDVKALAGMVEQEKNCINDIDKIVDIELAEQDFAARITNNIVILLLFNSSRPIRKRMLEIILTAISKDELSDYLNAKTTLLREFSGNTMNKKTELLDTFRAIILKYREKIIQSLQK